MTDEKIVPETGQEDGATDEELDDEMKQALAEVEGASPGDDEDDAELDDVDVRELLRGALRPPKGAVAPSLLRGVQTKLRVKSRGKFYGDGWSTAKAPRSTYLMTSVVMLVLMLVVFALLVPWTTGVAPGP